MTCKKISCYMGDLACELVIIEKAKIFQSFVEHFLVFPRERDCRILIDLCKWVFMNYPVMFLDQDNKTKIVSASFSCFLELVWEKNKFLLTKCDSYSR